MSQSTDPAMPRAPARLPILIVEDDPEERQLMSAILAHEGHPVRTASNLRQARQIRSSQTFAVIVVDLRLEDGDGLALLGDPAPRPRPVMIVVTAFTSIQSALSALKRGAYDYLAKPVAPDVLAATARRAAERFDLECTLATRTAQLEQANRAMCERIEFATRHIATLNTRLQVQLVRLAEARRAQNRILQNVIHELNNPITVIQGFTERLLKRRGETIGEPAAQEAAAILRNVGTLAHLVNDLSDSCRLENGRISLRLEEFEADAAVQEAVEACQAAAARRGVAVDCRPALPSRPTVYADRGRLRQILGNLLSNAIKFTPTGGRVSACAQAAADGSLLCVEDTGPGMAAEERVRIFERFYQAPQPDGAAKGLGLGLSIVKSLVELQGGWVRVESELGRGSRFLVMLPSRRPAAPTQTAHAVPNRRVSDRWDGP